MSACHGAHVLVIGDAMLDTFIVGRVTRISPEAPVPGRHVRSRNAPDRRRGQRRAQHHGARRPGDAHRGDWARTTTATTLDARLPRRRHRAASHRHRLRPRHDDEGAHRHRAQPAGRAHRLRERCGDRRETSSAIIVGESSSTRRGASAIVVSDYSEGLRHEDVSWTPCSRRQHTQQSRCSSIPRFRTSITTPARRVVTPNHHEAETATHTRVRSMPEARMRHARSAIERACDSGADDARRSGHVAADQRRRRSQLPASAREVAGRHRRRRHGHRDDGAGDSRQGDARRTARLANAAAGRRVVNSAPPPSRAAELVRATGLSAATVRVMGSVQAARRWVVIGLDILARSRHPGRDASIAAQRRFVIAGSWHPHLARDAARALPLAWLPSSRARCVVGRHSRTVRTLAAPSQRRGRSAVFSPASRALRRTAMRLAARIAAGARDPARTESAPHVYLRCRISADPLFSMWRIGMGATTRSSRTRSICSTPTSFIRTLDADVVGPGHPPGRLTARRCSPSGRASGGRATTLSSCRVSGCPASPTYLLVERLTGSRRAAFIAGLTYACYGTGSNTTVISSCR